MRIISLFTAMFFIGWTFPLSEALYEIMKKNGEHEALIFNIILNLGILLEFFRLIFSKADGGKLFLYFILSAILIPTLGW